MSTVVLKLFAGQGTGWMDRRTKRRLYAYPFREHNNIHFYQRKRSFFLDSSSFFLVCEIFIFSKDKQ